VIHIPRVQIPDFLITSGKNRTITSNALKVFFSLKVLAKKIQVNNRENIKKNVTIVSIRMKRDSPQYSESE